MRLSIPAVKKNHFLPPALLSLVCVGLLLLASDPFTLDEFEANIKADHIYYVQLAVGGPQSCHEAPYCWRVLQPMLVSLLPFDVQTGFWLVTVVSVWLTGIALFFLLHTYNFSMAYCLLGVLLFYSLGWATGFLFFYFWLGDGLAFLLIVLSIYFIRVNNYMCVLALVALGVAGKETVLAVVPLYYTLNLQPAGWHSFFEPRLLGKTALLGLPALGVLALVRTTIPSTNHYEILEVFAYYLSARAEGTVDLPMIIAPGLQGSLFSAFFFGNLATFGLMLLLPLLSPKRNFLLLLSYLPYVVLVNAQILVAEATERLLVYAFPVVILMSLYGLCVVCDRLLLTAWHLLPLSAGWFALTMFGGGWRWVFLSWQGGILAAYMVLLLVYLAVRARYDQYKRATAGS